MSNSTVSVLYKKLARLSLVFFTIAKGKAFKTPFLTRLPFISHQIKDYGVGIPVELAKAKGYGKSPTTLIDGQGR
jgi:hypothetical protein